MTNVNKPEEKKTPKTVKVNAGQWALIRGIKSKLDQIAVAYSDLDEHHQDVAGYEHYQYLVDHLDQLCNTGNYAPNEGVNVVVLPDSVEKRRR